MSLVHYKGETTRLGGVSGNGFMPGQSGNPGGRPKGLARRVRELVGDQGEAIAEFMFEVMNDESARRADRIDAGRWLADRGFGKAPVQTEIPACEHPSIDLSGFSPEDLEAMLAILERHDPRCARAGRLGSDLHRRGCCQHHRIPAAVVVRNCPRTSTSAQARRTAA